MSYQPKPIVSVKEARKILGKVADKMTNKQIEETVETLDAIAVEILKDAREKRMKEDAAGLAKLVYDVYRMSKQ